MSRRPEWRILVSLPIIGHYQCVPGLVCGALIRLLVRSGVWVSVQG